MEKLGGKEDGNCICEWQKNYLLCGCVPNRGDNSSLEVSSASTTNIFWELPLREGIGGLGLVSTLPPIYSKVLKTTPINASQSPTPFYLENFPWKRSVWAQRVRGLGVISGVTAKPASSTSI